MHTYKHIYMYVRTYIHTYIHKYICVHAYMHTYLMDVRMRANTSFTHTLSHTQSHICPIHVPSMSHPCMLCFAATTAECFFRIRPDQESMYYVTDICTDVLYILGRDPDYDMIVTSGNAGWVFWHHVSMDCMMD